MAGYRHKWFPLYDKLVHLFLGVRATGRFACTGMQRSEGEEEDTENDSSSQELINSALPPQDMNFVMIDPALQHNLDSIEPTFDWQFWLASPPSSQSSNSAPSTSRLRCQHNESPSPTSHKRPRNSRSSFSSEAATLADANKKAVYWRAHRVLSKQERAVYILELNYGDSDQYSTDNMVKTVYLFQDWSKACVFLGLSAGIVCDAWLRGLLDM